MKTLKYYNLHVTGGGNGHLHGTILDKSGNPIYDIDMGESNENMNIIDKKYPIFVAEQVDMDMRVTDRQNNSTRRSGEDVTVDLTFSTNGESITTVRMSEGDFREAINAMSETLSQLPR